MTARVSHVAAFARWKDDEDMPVGVLVNQIISNVETGAMRKGTAFHKFLEHAQAGEVPHAVIDGYTFAFVGEFELYLPMMREWRKGKDYGGIVVSGQVDAIEGGTIYDHKTTERFDAEKYLGSWQHRFYLDIFGADRFVWNVWEMKHVGEAIVPYREDGCNAGLTYLPAAGSKQAYEVTALHPLTTYRYPALESDCTELAQEYLAFAKKHMPQLEVA